MNHRSTFSLTLAGTLLASSAWAQNAQPPTDPPRVSNDAAVSMRGKIVRVQGENQLVVRTGENKEVTLYASPETRYVIRGKAGRFADLRVGTEINANYTLAGERHNVSVVNVGVLADTPRESVAIDAPAGGKIAQGTVMRGRIVKMQAPDQFVVRTTNDKEVIFYTTPQTRYTIDGRVVQYRDLKIGTEVNADYTLRDGRHIVGAVTVGGAAVVEPAPVPAPGQVREETRVEGTVVRIGDGRVVIRTGQDKEVTINVDPQTKYLIGENPGRISDIRAGSDVRIEYDVRDRRPVARIVNGIRRNK